jgi:hypothetical protein
MSITPASISVLIPISTLTVGIVLQTEVVCSRWLCFSNYRGRRYGAYPYEIPPRSPEPGERIF